MRMGEIFTFPQIPPAAGDETLVPTANDLAVTEDILKMICVVPIVVVRWGVMVSVDVTGTSVVVLDHSAHESDGSAPTRAAAVGGRQLSGVAQQFGGIQFCEPTSEVICKPGDFLHIEVTTGWTAGDGWGFIQYQQLNWAPVGDPNSDWSDTGTKIIDGSAAVA